MKKVGFFLKKMYNKIGKRNLTAALAVLLLGGAVYLNWKLFSPENEAIPTGKTYYLAGQVSAETPGNEAEEVSGKVSDGDSYFASAAVSRQRSRDEALEVLRLIVDNKDAVTESRTSAMSQMEQIAAEIAAESNIETLVRAKGFEECVAVVGSGCCTVIVKAEDLLPNEIAQIQEIVYEQAGILPSGVKLIEQG